ESDEVWPRLDSFQSELRGHSKQQCEVRRDDPCLARSLQEPHRVAHDTLEPRPLIRVGRVRVPVAQDQLALLEVSSALVDVRCAVRQEQRSEEHTSELESRVELVCR